MKRLLTSAKQRRIRPTGIAQAIRASTLYVPVSANTFDGSPKMPAPITPLMISATRSQRRMSRTRLARVAFSIHG